MLLSRKRESFDRPLLQPGANSNGLQLWTPARIGSLGAFMASAVATTLPVKTSVPVESGGGSARAVAVTSEAADEGADDGLSGLLAAIGEEVQGRTAAVQAGVVVEFAARIAHARKTLPRDQAAGAVAALKQAKGVALKLIREAASAEVRGRQRAVRVMRASPADADRSIRPRLFPSVEAIT